VWLAEHLRLGTNVAVKLMPAELLHRSPTAARRFASEARATAKINHPNIIRILDHGTTADGDGWMSMELLEGESLRARLEREERLSPELSGAVVEQVATALEAAHAVGVVHRDIKPDNIFVRTIRGRPFVKVLDFGVALVSGGSSRITGQGVLLGTPEYMSPEQLRSSKDVDPRADLWALAVVAYESLTGRLPFEGGTVTAILISVTRGKFPAPSSLVPTLGPAIDAWFAQAFATDLEARFATAEDLSASFLAAMKADAEAPEEDALERPALIEERRNATLAMFSTEPREVAVRPREPRADDAQRLHRDDPSAPPDTLPDALPRETQPEEPRLTEMPLEPIRIPLRPLPHARVTRGKVSPLALLGGLAVLGLVGALWWGRRGDGKSSAAVTSSIAASASAPTAPPQPKCDPGTVGIPAGRFRIGSARGEATEQPVREVAVAAFCLDAAEVTVAQFRECVGARACTEPGSSVRVEGVTEATRRSLGKLCNGAAKGRESHPINCVDWEQARAYCNFRGARLPTEEEWEYAARGGAEERDYPWGRVTPGPRLVNACGTECERMFARIGITTTPMFSDSDGHEGTAPVGSFREGDSRWGVHDLAGNVLEWTSSGWSDDYASPRSDSHRVVRGGAFTVNEPALLLGTVRDRAEPTERNNDLGFRCAVSPQ